MDKLLTTFSTAGLQVVLLAGQHEWHGDTIPGVCIEAFLCTGRRLCVCTNFLIPISICNFMKSKVVCLFVIRQVIGLEVGGRLCNMEPSCMCLVVCVCVCVAGS